MQIDWSDIEPTPRDRGTVERVLRALPNRERVVLSRRGSGYEARVVLELADRSTSLKLHAESLTEVVDRIAEIVSIVAAARHSQPHSSDVPARAAQ
jgi:hypothetical protein